MELRGKDVLVVGMKRSGMGAIELLRKHGARVRAMDAQVPTPEDLARLQALGVSVSPQQPENLGTPDLIVLSPAVPFHLPLFAPARERGVPVIGEVELASFFLKGPVIGITGSNGKTTTTALVGHLLRECGVRCQVGGNIGTAVTSLIGTSAEEQWNVLELSSFQLETIDRFRAHIGACLNVTPDHLDRHGTLDLYAAAKGRLLETQIAGDFAVLNYEDSICRGYARKTRAEVFWFSSKQPVPQGVAIENNALVYCGEPFLNRSSIKLRGMHNVENVMAATLMAHLAGVPLEELAPAVESFSGVEHRIEFVRKLDGVEYYNDSKATNVDATLKAVASFPGNLWIILGGKDKGSDYAPLAEALREKAKRALLIGAATQLIAEALKDRVPLEDCGTLERAVRYAREHAEAGDFVLLAPACASFDQFENFEHRGRVFKQIVAELL
ncbi:MAG TPA: UDP-N-acetylmuramoyl-L-alanine--D-glutamate ligase [Bryobacteraceae bacterium]|nr:UDP-N-acetylmuramoyl-L-alanine--D-glutamate ligase [Bryobacteraceae bacterium]